MMNPDEQLANLLYERLGEHLSKVLLSTMRQATLNDIHMVEVLNELAKIVGEDADFQ